MNVILETGFSAINYIDDFWQSTKTKDEKLISSKHLMRVREIKAQTKTVIEGMSCAQLYPSKTDFDVDKEDAHIFTVDDLKDINCAPKEIVILENRKKEGLR
jgi:hypothetical protein